MEAEGATEDGGGFMVQAQFVSMGRRHDYRDALGLVEAPALVVHGEDDLQPESASREYVETLPRAELAVVNGAGHQPFADQPGRFAAIVGPFLIGLVAG